MRLLATPVLAIIFAFSLLLPSAHAMHSATGALPYAGQTIVITIDGTGPTPPSITITPGTAVQWQNRDDIAHTISADDGSFGPLSINDGDTSGAIVLGAGVHTYRVDHVANSMGTIVVDGSTPTAETTSTGTPNPPPPPPTGTTTRTSTPTGTTTPTPGATSTPATPSPMAPSATAAGQTATSTASPTTSATETATASPTPSSTPAATETESPSPTATGIDAIDITPTAGVTVTNGTLNPQIITVTVGMAVRWTNLERFPIMLVARGAFSLGPIAPRAAVSQLFPAAGRYPYELQDPVASGAAMNRYSAEEQFPPTSGLIVVLPPDPTSTITPSDTPSPSATATQSPATETPTPAAPITTPSLPVTPTATPSPSVSPTATPSSTATPSPSATPIAPTATPMPSATSSPIPSGTPTAEAILATTSTATPTPSASPTVTTAPPTVTMMPSTTPVTMPSPSPTSTPTATTTPSPTATAPPLPIATATAPPSPTDTATPTITTTPTPTATTTPTATATPTTSPTASGTALPAQATVVPTADAPAVPAAATPTDAHASPRSIPPPILAPLAKPTATKPVRSATPTAPKSHRPATSHPGGAGGAIKMDVAMTGQVWHGQARAGLALTASLRKGRAGGRLRMHDAAVHLTLVSARIDHMSRTRQGASLTGMIKMGQHTMPFNLAIMRKDRTTTIDLSVRPLHYRLRGTFHGHFVLRVAHDAAPAAHPPPRGRKGVKKPIPRRHAVAKTRPVNTRVTTPV